LRSWRSPSCRRSAGLRLQRPARRGIPLVSRVAASPRTTPHVPWRNPSMTRTLLSRMFASASAVAMLFSLAVVARAEPAAGKQTPESLDLGNGSKMGYQLYLPESYGKDPAAKVPVIIFLHGSGEAGDGTTQLDKVKIHGPP